MTASTTQFSPAQQAKIIKSTVRSLHMKAVIAASGWTEQQAAEKVVDYLTCGKQISLHDFMVEAQAVATQA